MHVLVIQMVKRRTKPCEHIQREGKGNILELNVTSHAILDFRTEHLVVYNSREVNRTVRV